MIIHNLCRVTTFHPCFLRAFHYFWVKHHNANIMVDVKLGEVCKLSLVPEKFGATAHFFFLLFGMNTYSSLTSRKSLLNLVRTNLDITLSWPMQFKKQKTKREKKKKKKRKYKLLWWYDKLNEQSKSVNPKVRRMQPKKSLRLFPFLKAILCSSLLILSFFSYFNLFFSQCWFTKSKLTAQSMLISTALKKERAAINILIENERSSFKNIYAIQRNYINIFMEREKYQKYFEIWILFRKVVVG